MTIFPLTLIRTGGLPFNAWKAMSGGMPDWMHLRTLGQELKRELLLAYDEALAVLPASKLRTDVYNCRKKFFQQDKMPSTGLITSFREKEALSLLLKKIEAWEQYQLAQKTAEYQYEEGLRSNYKALQSCPTVENDLLQRALLFASHDLLGSLPEFMGKQVDDFNKKDRRTAFSLLQYLTRTIFKTAPLGRFTTVQLRSLSAFHRTNERVGEWQQSKFLVSPNVALLPALYDVLLKEPAFYESLSLSLNPCIVSNSPTEEYRISEHFWLYFDGEREAFQQMDPDPVADLVVQALLKKDRTMTYTQLIEMLLQMVDATEIQLNAYVFKLIDIGLLEWRLPEQGLAANWCNGLYNYLGYLPSSSVLTEAAYLIQWMRTTARTLPFQSIAAAKGMQLEAEKELNAFFKRQNQAAPPIPPEQLFFEDVAAESTLEMPAGIAENLTAQLSECWEQKPITANSPFRARLLAFGAQLLAPGERMDFLGFSRAFLESKQAEAKAPPEFLTQASLSKGVEGSKIGALLQVFQENGQYKAVVNAMYPGGGKLFARWHALFTTDVVDQLKDWNMSDRIEAAFPWQGWSNANFQPSLFKNSLVVPGGRGGQFSGGRSILLGDLMVQNVGNSLLQIIEKEQGLPVFFNDLGLEAPETRPAAIQVLWNLGVPAVSSGQLMPPAAWNWEPLHEVKQRRRIVFQSLVISRAAWKLSAQVCQALFLAEKPRAARIASVIITLKDWGLPRWFFGQFLGNRERPQFYDMESPISMMLLEKNMRGGQGELLLTEMLPTPEQWLGERATEWVVEFKTGGRVNK